MGVSFGDIDADGDLDLVISAAPNGAYTSEGIYVYTYQAGAYTLVSSANVLAGTIPGRPEFVDVDLDGVRQARPVSAWSARA